MENILGMRGQGVGDTSDFRGHPGHSARQGGEMRVQMGDAVIVHGLCQRHALGDLVGG